MNIIILFLCLFCAIPLQVMNAACLSSSTAEKSSSPKDLLKTTCRTILTNLQGTPDSQALETAFSLIRSSMQQLSPNFAIALFNTCGIWSALKPLADQGNCEASYLLCCLLEDKQNNQDKLLSYLRIASKTELAASMWLLSLEKDSAAVVSVVDSCKQHVQNMTTDQKKKVLTVLGNLCTQEQPGTFPRLLEWSLSTDQSDDLVTALAPFIQNQRVFPEVTQELHRMHDELTPYCTRHSAFANSLLAYLRVARNADLEACLWLLSLEKDSTAVVSVIDSCKQRTQQMTPDQKKKIVTVLGNLCTQEQPGTFPRLVEWSLSTDQPDELGAVLATFTKKQRASHEVTQELYRTYDELTPYCTRHSAFANSLIAYLRVASNTELVACLWLLSLEKDSAALVSVVDSCKQRTQQMTPDQKKKIVTALCTLCIQEHPGAFPRLVEWSLSTDQPDELGAVLATFTKKQRASHEVTQELYRTYDELTPYCERHSSTAKGLIAYLRIASKKELEACLWLLTLEKDAVAVVSAIDFCEKHAEQMTAEQRRKVLAALHTLCMQEQLGAFPRLLEWSLRVQQSDELVMMLATIMQKNDVPHDVMQALHRMHTKLIQFSLRYPAVAYYLGWLYFKYSRTNPKTARKLNERALEFWRAAHTRGYTSGTWRCITQGVHDGIRNTHDHVARFKAAVEKTREQVSGKENAAASNQNGRNKLHELALVTEARAGIEAFEKNSRTSEELFAVADVYLKGLPGVISADEQRAALCFKNGYTRSFLDTQKKGVSSMVAACGISLQTLEGVTSADAACKRKALISMLQGCKARSLEAVILLTRIYAYGLYGIPQDTNELLNVCKLWYGRSPHIADLHVFLAETKLYQLLDDQGPQVSQQEGTVLKPHYPVHYFVIGILLATAEIEPSLLEELKNALVTLEETYDKDPDYGELLHLLGTLDYAIQRIGHNPEQVDVAMFFASLALKHVEDNGIEQATELQRKGARSALEMLCSVLTHRCLVHDVPFLSSDRYGQELYRSLRSIVLRRSQDSDTELRTTVLRTYGLCELLVDADYLSTSFRHGLEVLGQLALEGDEMSRTVITHLHNSLVTQLSFSPLMTQPLKKLQCLFSLILVDLHNVNSQRGAINYLRLVMQYVRERQIDEYESFCEKYDPLELFAPYLNIPTDENELLPLQLRCFVYLAFHYTLLVSRTTDKEKARVMEGKAKILLQRASNLNAYLLHYLLALEYLQGIAIGRNIAECERHFTEVIRIAQAQSTVLRPCEAKLGDDLRALLLQKIASGMDGLSEQFIQELNRPPEKIVENSSGDSQ